MTAKNWSKLSKDFKGQWIALKDDEITVVAHDKLAKKTLEKAETLGYKNPILFKVPPKDITYIG